MKKAFLVLCIVFFGTATTVAQEKDDDWGDVQGNTLTMKEIGPIWPGCEGPEAERSSCFNQKLARHIQQNFKYPAKEYSNNIQGRVVVTFVIDEIGRPAIKNTVGGSQGLQVEARRNILLIPQMKPGMLGGKPRAIQYTVPFTFKTGK